jgi:hypothetical protein
MNLATSFIDYFLEFILDGAKKATIRRIWTRILVYVKREPRKLFPTKLFYLQYWRSFSK